MCTGVIRLSYHKLELDIKANNNNNNNLHLYKGYCIFVIPFSGQHHSEMAEAIYHQVFLKLSEEHKQFLDLNQASQVLPGQLGKKRKPNCGGWPYRVPRLVLSMMNIRCPPFSLLWKCGGFILCIYNRRTVEWTILLCLWVRQWTNYLNQLNFAFYKVLSLICT